MPETNAAGESLAFAVPRLRKLEHEIARCCDQLTEEEIWRRGGGHENSVANVLLGIGGRRRWRMPDAAPPGTGPGL